MAKPLSFDESGDSDDLQALFDTIAAGSSAPVPPPVVTAADTSGDSDELQALFDSVMANATTEDAPPGDEEVFTRLGHLTRQLHDSLRELGYDRALQETASQIPDARQRLAYIVQMTEQAASRVLNATDIARPLQEGLLDDSKNLGERWERMFANQLSVDEFKSLAADTRGFFGAAPDKIARTNEQLTEIMMAQDFQDLTGQVIRKVVDMVQGLEGRLVQILIEALPPERRPEANNSLMNGPVINSNGRQDVVTSQTQVDELLESLGF